MRPEVAQAVMFAAMSDVQILEAYVATTRLEPKSSLAKALGFELLTRLHRAAPDTWPDPAKMEKT